MYVKKGQSSRVGTGRYFEWIKGFTTTKRKRIGINIIPVTISQ
jgi:hypothetical protein